jgi:hypothetical protein
LVFLSAWLFLTLIDQVVEIEISLTNLFSIMMCKMLVHLKRKSYKILYSTYDQSLVDDDVPRESDDTAMISVRKPGKNLSKRSCVAVHKVHWRSLRLSSSEGGTSIPAAFMTRITFFKDSGMASRCDTMSGQSLLQSTLQNTYQLVALVYAHQPVKKI